jgi:ribosomal protein S18 acetylase RimI-like enzyme
MALIDAAPRPIRGMIQSGIRPFDIGRDLRPVAELIADAFTNELDPRGLAALREMRIMSHLSGLLKLLSRSTGDLDDVFSGFVWVEDGKIVGNVTVQRADKYGNRWQIANVAVAHNYRGRGIARRLMEQALAHVANSDGRWAVLQVYDHNTVARRLYSQLGFEEVGGMVDFRLARVPKVDFPARATNFHSFTVQHWQPLYELATNQLNTQTQWWRAMRRSDFQASFEQQIGAWMWQTMGRQQIFRRCFQSLRRFEAALVLTAERWRGTHELQMWVRPEQYGLYEQYMVQWVVATLQEFPRWSVKVTLSSEHNAGMRAVEQFGFKPQQTLVTMRRRIGDNP